MRSKWIPSYPSTPHANIHGAGSLAKLTDIRAPTIRPNITLLSIYMHKDDGLIKRLAKWIKANTSEEEIVLVYAPFIKLCDDIAKGLQDRHELPAVSFHARVKDKEDRMEEIFNCVHKVVSFSPRTSCAHRSNA